MAGSKKLATAAISGLTKKVAVNAAAPTEAYKTIKSTKRPVQTEANNSIVGSAISSFVQASAAASTT